MQQYYLNNLRKHYDQQRRFKAELPSQGKQGNVYLGNYKFVNGTTWIERKDIQFFQQNFPYVTIQTKGD